jgi:16S rRNA processing protein RimM
VSSDPSPAFGLAGAPREVAVGVVRRAFGLGGEVFVHPDPDLAEDFPVGRRYRVTGPPGPAELTVADSWVHRGLQVVRFEEVTDRDGAAALREAVLWRAADPDDLDEDAFWAGELVGLPVVDGDGNPLGTVDALLDGTAHDYLVVGEVLVPAVADIVTVEPDRVVVRPPPGLFDPDAAELA